MINLQIFLSNSIWDKFRFKDYIIEIDIEEVHKDL